jgi:hypothetical protein
VAGIEEGGEKEEGLELSEREDSAIAFSCSTSLSGALSGAVVNKLLK